MGRISDVIPSLYFQGKNDLKKFLDALDVSVSEIESKIKKLPELIDVDTCPDDKLPYLAALTGCPLVGEDNILRRRQIRNWPHLLKLKGTQKSLELYLNSIGADDHKIMTYFRDADGSYIETKPDGEPFKGDDGLWYNIRTHYFGLEIIWDNHEYLRWQGWNEDLEERMAFWMKNFKPFYAELLKWNNLIYETSSHSIKIGTAVFTAPHLIIAPAGLDSAASKGNIAAATGLFNAPSYNIKLARNDKAKSKASLSSTTGLFNSAHNKIKSAQNDKSQGKTSLSSTTGLFNSAHNKIKLALNDKAQGNANLCNAAGIFETKFYKTRQAMSNTAANTAGLSSGGAKFCSKFYTINQVL